MGAKGSGRGWRIAAGAGALWLGWRAVRRALTPEIDGQVALVTGSSRGLGLLMARQLAAEGCRLVICARDEAELEKARLDLAARRAEVLAVVCDVSDERQVADLVEVATERFGGIDILVNNAGILQVGPVETMSARDFREALETDFMGAVHATFAVLPQMRARGTGRIVNITSIGGKVAVPHLLPYDAAKFALVGFSEGLRAELREQGILVTTIVPGLIRTGSAVNARFKGEKEREFSWFSTGDAAWLTSTSAERAARRIVLALRRGETEVVIGWQARALRFFHDLSPAAAAGIFSLFNRALPHASGRSTESSRGMELASAVPPSRLAHLMSKAAQAFNQYGSESAEPFRPNGHQAHEGREHD